MHSEQTQSPKAHPQGPPSTPGSRGPTIRSHTPPDPDPAQLGQPTRHCELTATQPDQPIHPPPKMHVHRPNTQSQPRTSRPQNQPPTHRTRRPTEPGVRQHPPKAGCHAGGSGGSSPRKSTASHRRRPSKRAEHRATPGGYGGKPPGVAIIGVPTGARNAGSGAPTGDQSTDMNATRKHPLVCQDPIPTRSREEAEQRDQLSLPPGRVGRWPFRCSFPGDGPAGSRVAGRLGRYSKKPRVLPGSRPPLANTTAK
jgi:hypothetical protein